jgi:hypothetical protein
MQNRGSREDRPRRDRDRYGDPREGAEAPSAAPEPAAAPAPVERVEA